jgi:hypothetical protein
MKAKLLPYKEVVARLDQCTEMACVLIRNTRPFWNPEAWLYALLRLAFDSTYNHSAVFFYKDGVPILVCQAIGKGVVFEDFTAWAFRELRETKQLAKRRFIFNRQERVLDCYGARYDYWKYLRGIFVEQNKWAREGFTERTRSPFYCHEIAPFIVGEKNGPWHPNRLISFFGE